MLRSLRPFVFLLLAATFVLTPGCDAVEDALPDEATVELGDAGNNIPVVPGAAATPAQSVDGADVNLPNVFDIEGVALEGVTFDPAVPTLHKQLASGTINVFIILEQVPVIGATIIVEDDEVTNAPVDAPVGIDDFTAFTACYSDIEDPPTLAAGYQEENASEIIEDAIEQESISIAILTCVDGDLAGTLGIDRMVVNLDY